MQMRHADPEPVSRSFSLQVKPAVGETLGERYRLDREAVRTEAGVVFDATDTSTGRRVAVEVASSLEDPKARRKWARDGRLAQRLEGEHVLRVLDVGNTASNVPFVVRESALATLASELDARGALPLPQAIGWTLEACEAVAEAHAVGMAHGDLRLDNMYLARGRTEPTVKVAWTSAAKAERAAKEDVQRDIAGLGAMLRVLATGQMNIEAEGAPTLPTSIAHAVTRALADDAQGAFHNVSELARELAPFAPPGHASARTVSFLLSRAGIVGKAIPVSGGPGSGPPSGPESTRTAAVDLAPESAPRSSRRRADLGPIGPTAQANVDRVSMTEAWFGRGAQQAQDVAPSLLAQLGAEEPKKRGRSFTVVSLLLVAAVLGGSWLLYASGKLPRWTGAAPPDEVGTTGVTSAPDERAQAAAQAQQQQAEADKAAADTAAGEKASAEAEATKAAERAAADAKAKAAAARSTTVDALPNAPATPTTAPAPSPAGAAPKTSSDLRYADPSEIAPSAATGPAPTQSVAPPATENTAPASTPAALTPESTTVAPASPAPATDSPVVPSPSTVPF